MAKKIEETKKLRRVIDGKVSNIIDASTIKVKVERKFPHPKYGKIIMRHKSYIVDTNGIEVNLGDVVTFGEVKPISKRKTWQIINKDSK